MITIEIISSELARDLCRKITTDLPEYFGLPVVNEHYVVGVSSKINVAAKIDGEYVGLISLDMPYPESASIYWMAVLRRFHGVGVGRRLLDAALQQARSRGAHTITVETLSPDEADVNYLKTYHFYKVLGFQPLFNLKPEGYEWNMVYMLKIIDDACLDKKTDNLLIRPFEKKDISVMAAAFSLIGWNKPPSLFEEYLREVGAGERLVWIAFVRETFAGYITLKWQSHYPYFKENGIPEIMDLNVLPSWRKMGIGSRLLDVAESEAAVNNPIVGIGVGLYAGEDGGYGSAQRLYVKRGYIPDGKGLTYNYQYTTPGNSYPLDDDLVFWFTKKLRKEFA